MIRLQLPELNSVEDAHAMLQTAIGVEFGTLPPYLYALYSIPPGTNTQAAQLIKSVALQEMIHLCLDCNILNALGGTPEVKAQIYPGPLPGDIGPDGEQLILHLYPFSEQAMEQAMNIEQPEEKPDIPVAEFMLTRTETAVTIGQFYTALDKFLQKLPADAWQPGRNQIVDNQFFPGQLFAINNYNDAHQAIQDIISEGEGTAEGTEIDPLDFQGDYAHYYRFGEIYYNKVLTKADTPQGYTWGPESLGVDWSAVYPAIADPGAHDFTNEPEEARAAQDACNLAFTKMIDALNKAVNGQAGELGTAVQAMFQLRMAALHAFTVPLADSSTVAGPAFKYLDLPTPTP